MADEIQFSLIGFRALSDDLTISSIALIRHIYTASERNQSAVNMNGRLRAQINRSTTQRYLMLPESSSARERKSEKETKQYRRRKK